MYFITLCEGNFLYTSFHCVYVRKYTLMDTSIPVFTDITVVVLVYSKFIFSVIFNI